MKQSFFVMVLTGLLLLSAGAMGCGATTGDAEAGKTKVTPQNGQGAAFKEVVEAAPKIDTAPPGQFNPKLPMKVEGNNPPIKINWKILEDVKFAEKYYPAVNAYMLFPTFGPQVKALNGKYVELEGYIIPVDQPSNLYVISAYNNASCFFCGNAGPNSVMELELTRKHPEFRMDQWQCFRGYLRLNDSDIDRMNFILDKAEVCK